MPARATHLDSTDLPWTRHASRTIGFRSSIPSDTIAGASLTGKPTESDGRANTGEAHDSSLAQTPGAYTSGQSRY